VPELDTHVAVVEPAELAALERLGFSLGVLVRGRELPNTETLNQDAGFKSIFDVLRGDLLETKAKHPGAKVTSVDGVRLFDAEWLSAERMSFELIGAFNRLDRRAFYQGTCGEVRFIYRLGYAIEQGKAPMKFRLPMTLNVVFLVADADCQATARAWQSEPGLAGDSLVAWLVDEGPLGEASRRHWSLKSVEANVQSVRLQSSMHPSMAGHIEYVMRVFEAADPARERFVPRVMENMPDVALLQRDAALRSELLTLLRQPSTLAALDDGVLQLPERFLARRASPSRRAVWRGGPIAPSVSCSRLPTSPISILALRGLCDRLQHCSGVWTDTVVSGVTRADRSRGSITWATTRSRHRLTRRCSADSRRTSGQISSDAASTSAPSQLPWLPSNIDPCPSDRGWGTSMGRRVVWAIPGLPIGRVHLATVA